MNHLRHSGLPFAKQAAALKTILRADPIVWEALVLARGLDLPDGMVVSGAIYNSAWNSLTGKPPGHGVKDIDLFYCDGSDLSYEAEDAVILRAASHFEHLPLPVEVRNQARVHLWYPDRFGRICPAYRSSAEALGYFASRTHAVGVRLTAAEDLEVIAPFGLDDIFSFRITPNKVMDNRETPYGQGRARHAIVARDHGRAVVTRRSLTNSASSKGTQCAFFSFSAPSSLERLPASFCSGRSGKPLLQMEQWR